MKRKSYRDRYFEDYQAVRKPGSNRKGYRIVYQYVGLWTAWRSEKINLKSYKIVIAIWELVSILLYLACASADTSINSYRLASGFGILSIAPWLCEISGVIRFCLSGEYVRELSYEEIDKSIRYGCPLHIILTIASVLAGSIQAVVSKTFSAGSGFLAAGMLVSAGLTYAIWHAYRELLIEKYHNEDGKAGSRC